MAVTEQPAVASSIFRAPASSTLQALTSAALLLPGLLIHPVKAAEPSSTTSLQYSRYSESQRDLLNVDSRLPALAADTLAANIKTTLRNGYQVTANLTQDSWSGATPIATAPLAAGSNRPVLRNAASGVVISGASPLLNGTVLLNRSLQPVAAGSQDELQPDDRNVLVMSSASPEARKQADLALVRQDNSWTLRTRAGVSTEPDFLSRFISAGGSLDFNQRLSRLNVDLSYTHNRTRARLDADALPYLTRTAYASQLTRVGDTELLQGTRVDRGISIGLSQVINAATQMEILAGHSQSQGFMENPYKATTVIFTGNTSFASPAANVIRGDVRALLEQRPDRRRQHFLRGHVAHHYDAVDAAAHLDYRYSRDDWGTEAHTLELQWVQSHGPWQFIPYLRGYRQSAADFHAPYLTSAQDYRRIKRDASGNELWLDADDATAGYARTPGGEFIDGSGDIVDVSHIDLQPQWTMFSAALLPSHFSSDHRLAAFDTASAGFTVSREFDRGLIVEAGFEYYRRADDLFGSRRGDGGFADFDAVMANLGVRVDLQASARRLRRENQQHPIGHAEHATSHQHRAPASLMFAHQAMPKGTLMTGYRFSSQRQNGDMLQGADTLADVQVVETGCGNLLCRETPASMTMTMHMIDFAYAMTDRLTLLLMPQFMSMDMQLRELPAPPATPGTAHMHGAGNHHSAGRGDTIVGALWQVSASALHSWQAGMALSVPTGKVDLSHSRRFQNDSGLRHVDMQTGSGSWDLLPFLTYSGNWRRGYWGMQLHGTARLQHNKVGYRAGNIAQYSAWAGYDAMPWLSASLRASYLKRGSSHGEIDALHAQSGPMDFLANQGSSGWDLGVGLQATLAGSDLSLEWSIPVTQHVQGVQLEKDRMLNAVWHYRF